MEKLIEAVQKAVQIRSYSDEEGSIAQYLLELMKNLGYDEAHIDTTGNVVGRVGSGPKILQFDGHMDTVGWRMPSCGRFRPSPGSSWTARFGAEAPWT